MVAYPMCQIEPHAALLEKPSQDTLLYKIIQSKYFIDMIEKNYLYFRRVDTYNDDVRDSDQPNIDKERSDTNRFENSPNYSARQYYNDCRSRTYACCFSTEGTDHIWEHYAENDPNAVCVIFNSTKLIELLNSIFGNFKFEYNGKIYKNNFFDINYGLVKYGNFNSQLMDEQRPPNPIEYVYFKDAEYSEEKEFRVSISCIGIGKFLLPNGAFFEFPESIQLDFDLINAISLNVIEKIDLSPEFFSTIRKKLEQKISASDIDRILYIKK